MGQLGFIINPNQYALSKDPKIYYLTISTARPAVMSSLDYCKPKRMRVIFSPLTTPALLGRV
jgi:hypothetical protein